MVFSLEKGFFDVDDVVGLDAVRSGRVGLDALAVGVGAAQLDAALAAARR